MTKQTKEERIDLEIDGEYFDENKIFDKKLDEIIEYLEKYLQVATDSGYTDIILEKDYDYDYERCSLMLKGKRLETDEEYERRKRTEEKIFNRREKERLKKEAKERETYERLKKKFENK